MIVHQFVPNLEPGAVGAHTLLAREQLRAAGHQSDIFTAEVHEASERDGAKLVRDYRGDADVIVYQMAIGSVVADAVLQRAEPLVVNHHNLTPMRFITGWQPVAAHGVQWGRAQLRALAERAALGLAVSAYNEADLVEAGFAHTAVVPYLLDSSTLTNEPDPHVTRRDETTWLFVGRLAPNKCQHDIVKALAAYRQFHDPTAHLMLVGGGVDEPYGRALGRFTRALDLDDAVTFAGSVSPAELAAHYRTADVFVVCSEHEGFCVPVVEAMYHGLPVVAYGAAALPETIDTAGVVLGSKDPCTVAAAAHRVCTDTSLRAQLVADGHTRARAFDVSITGPQFVAAVTGVAR